MEFYEEVRRSRSTGRKVLGTCAESVRYLGSSPMPWPQTIYGCAFQIKKYEKLETEEERVVRSREIFDSYIMKELLACSHVSVSVSCPWVPTRAGPQQPGVGREERALYGTHSHFCLLQPFSKNATEHVQGHLVKKQVPPDLFQVRAGFLSLWPTLPRPGPPASDSWSSGAWGWMQTRSPGANRLGHQLPAPSPQPYIEEICQNLRGDVFQKFIER